MLLFLLIFTQFSYYAVLSSESVKANDNLTTGSLTETVIKQSLEELNRFFDMIRDYENEEQINMIFKPKNLTKIPAHDKVLLDDEVHIETVDDHTHDFRDRSDSFPSATDGQEHIQGYNLPIVHRKETLQDIYKREKLPEIQKILASGDQKQISKLIKELDEDPFTILPNNLRYSQLLAADVFFGFLSKMVTWFVMIALLLPIMVPGFTLLSLGAELLALWLIPDAPT